MRPCCLGPYLQQGVLVVCDRLARSGLRQRRSPPARMQHVVDDGPLPAGVDVGVVRDILHDADALERDATLVDVLDAYERVLPGRGIAIGTDLTYYEALLTLHLRPERGWHAKLQSLLDDGRHAARSTAQRRAECDTGAAATSEAPAPEPAAAAAAAAHELYDDGFPAGQDSADEPERVEQYIARMELSVKVDVFAAWKRHTAENRSSSVAKRAVLVKADAFREEHALQACVQRWRMRTTRSAAMRHAAAALTRAQRLLYARKLCGRLLSAIQQRKRIRNLQVVVTSRSVTCRIRHAVSSWARFVRDGRRRRMAQMDALRLARVRALWTAWRDAAWHHVDVRRCRLRCALQRWAQWRNRRRPGLHPRLVPCLLTWIEASTGVDLCRAVHHGCAETALARMNGAAPIRWRKGSHRVVCQQIVRVMRPRLVECVTAWRTWTRRCRGVKRAALARWRAALSRVLDLQRAADNVVDNLVRRRATRAWRRLCAYQRACRALLPRYDEIRRRALGARHLRAWRQRCQAIAMSRASARSSRFRQWRARYARRRLHQGRNRHAHQQAGRARRQRAWTTWRAACQAVRRVRQGRAVADRFRLRRLLRRWCDARHCSCRVSADLAAAAARHARHRRLLAFTEWRRVTLATQRHRRMVHVVERHACRRAIRALRRHVDARARERQAVQAAARHRRVARCRAGVRALRVHVRERRTARQVDERARRIHVSHRWNDWRAYVRGRALRRVAERHVLQRWVRRFRGAVRAQATLDAGVVADFQRDGARRRRHHVVRCWIASLTLRVAIRRLRCASTLALSVRRIRASWCAWRRTFLARRERDEHARRVAACLLTHRKRRLLAAWFVLGDRRRHARHVEGEVRSRSTLRTLHRAWHVWRDAQAYRLSAAAKHDVLLRSYRVGFARRVLHRWRVWCRARSCRARCAATTLRRAARVWVRAARARRRARQAAQQFRARVNRVHMRRAFTRILAVSTSLLSRQVALLRCADLHERAALRCDLRVWLANARLVAVGVAVERDHAERTRRRVLDAWHDELGQRRQRCRVVQRSVLRCWAAHARCRRAVHALQVRAMRNRAGRTRHCVWATWTRRCADARQADRLQRHLRRRRTLSAWRSRLAAVLQQQRLAERTYALTLYRRGFARMRARVVLVGAFRARQRLRVLRRWRMARVERVADRHLRRDAWRQWRQAHRVALQNVHRRRAARRAAWGAWRHALGIRRRVRAFRLQRAIRSWRRYCLAHRDLVRVRLLATRVRSRRAIAFWMRAAARQRRSSAIADRIRKWVLLRRWHRYLARRRRLVQCRRAATLRRWRRRTRTRLRLRQCARVLRAAKVFNAWSAWARHRQDLANAMARVTRGRVRPAWAVWRAQYEQRARADRLGARLGALRVRRVQKAAWTSWVTLVKERRRERHLDAVAEYGTVRLRLVRGYTALLGAYRSACRVRAFAAARQRRRQRAAFVVWRAAYARQCVRHQQEASAVHFGRLCLFRRVRAALRLCQLGSLFQRRHELAISRHAWRAWQRSLQAVRRVALHRRRRLQSSLANAVGAFRDNARRRRRCRSELARMTQQFATRCPWMHNAFACVTTPLTVAFRAWLVVVLQRRRLDRLLEQYRNSGPRWHHLTRRVLSAWTQAFVDRRYRVRFAALHTGSAIRHWVRWYRSRQARRSCKRLAFGHYDSVVRARCWRVWQDALLLSWRLSHLARSVTRAHERSSLKTCFLRWFRQFLIARHARDAVERAARHHRLTLQRGAFKALQAKWLFSKRRAEYVVMRARRLDLLLQAWCFDAWMQYGRAQRQLRDAIRLQELSLMVRKDVFSAWRLYVRRIRWTRERLEGQSWTDEGQPPPGERARRPIVS